MTFIEFIFLSVINLGVITFIIRKRSIASAEGLCMAYLGMAVLTDNVELILHYFLSPELLPLGQRELAFRLYPTAVQILGLLILIGGLCIADGKPTPVSRDLTDFELLRLKTIGIAVTVVGLTLTLIALYLVGALSSLDFYASLNSFRDQALPFGGFWYRGADIAVFGLALTLPSLSEKRKCAVSVFALMVFISFFLRTNKGGLEEPILWGGIALFVYNRKFLQSLLNVRTFALALVLAFLGIGAKFWLLPQAMERSSSAQGSLVQLVKMAAAGTSERWGDDGLYRGYCQFVSSLPDNRYLFSGSKVGVYSLTSWVPRFLYPNKPDHPFRGLGFTIYSDFHTYPDETPAPLLAGSAMADNGFASLVAYLFVAGLFLGWFRALAAGSKSLYWQCGYLLFVLFGGFSAEEGTLGLIYTLLLAYGVVLAARLILAAKGLMTVRMAFPARITAAPDKY
jgi:hypothetical protein